VQGLTLPLLIKWLKIKPATVEQQKEEDSLNLLLTESSLGYINNVLANEIDEVALERIKKQFEFNYKLLFNRNQYRLKKKQIESQLNSVNEYLNAQLKLIVFQRELILKFQNEDRFGEEALSKAERELDIEELRLNSLINKAEGSANATTDETNS
jgi:CPA1 family monovalent cation:H+ antiporter